MIYPACSIKPGAAHPTHVEVFPEVAHAALKEKEQGQLAVWLLLRAIDGRGSGRIAAVDARKLIAEARGLSQRQARRLLGSGESRYWVRDPGGHVRYLRTSRLCARLGVERVSRLRRIRVSDLGAGEAALKASLAATVYRWDDLGSPLTRRKVRELTGIPEGTQRRYENTYGHAQLVERVFTKITDERPGDVVSWFAHDGVWGFFRGRHGQLMRRHGDIRRSRHECASARAARRVNRELSGTRCPVNKAHGQPRLRVYFQEPGAKGAQAWTRARSALGKASAARAAFDPVLNYSVLCRRGRRGQRVWESIAEPNLKEDIV